MISQREICRRKGLKIENGLLLQDHACSSQGHLPHLYFSVFNHDLKVFSLLQ